MEEKISGKTVVEIDERDAEHVTWSVHHSGLTTLFLSLLMDLVRLLLSLRWLITPTRPTTDLIICHLQYEQFSRRKRSIYEYLAL